MDNIERLQSDLTAVAWQLLEVCVRLIHTLQLRPEQMGYPSGCISSTMLTLTGAVTSPS